MTRHWLYKQILAEEDLVFRFKHCTMQHVILSNHLGGTQFWFVHDPAYKHLHWKMIWCLHRSFRKKKIFSHAYHCVTSLFFFFNSKEGFRWGGKKGTEGWSFESGEFCLFLLDTQLWVLKDLRSHLYFLFHNVPQILNVAWLCCWKSRGRMVKSQNSLQFSLEKHSVDESSTSTELLALNLSSKYCP